METNIVYLTYRDVEPLMASFGMQIVTLSQTAPLRHTLRELVNQNTTIIYVSNEVYKNNQDLIDGYNADTLTLIVFDTHESLRPQGVRRMRHLLESSIGIKTR
ncbi:hypothetical protein G7062_05895 [Erysipelothrix sp. HDW6C]|uniref:V-type ATP synthase subunit F n=1 Tax=Erysipelothrix sp. HDW6C TaxID=2714930 RepID=UPI00140B5E97|nr:V-type ATP synthase subunit F [Erysipelothrix sp. HDW6C]QIK69852.1 hypothetical protein G7062_05895 [Erysipelothrix sp. HDW6C]